MNNRKLTPFEVSLSFAALIAEMILKFGYAMGTIDQMDKMKRKKICKHGNFIVDGNCMCTTCKKGEDY